MELNTLEDFEKLIPNEEAARKYLINLRWGQWAKCPYCGNPKAWMVKARFKCAHKDCRKFFSITVKTLFEDSHLPLGTVLKIFYLYGRSRGRISSFELSEQCGISHKAEFFNREKLDFIWKYIGIEGKTMKDIFDDMLRTSFDSYDRFIEIKHAPYYKNPFHISEINDISDIKQYNQLARYTKYYINVYCAWIWCNFASPEDVISETFIWLKENNIYEYNAETIIKYIQKSVNRMWYEFIVNHPRHSEYFINKVKFHKRESRKLITTGYIVELLAGRKDNKSTRKEIRNNKQLIEETRKCIIELRKKEGRYFDTI